MLPAHLTVQLPEFYHFRIYRGTFGKTRYGTLGKKLHSLCGWGKYNMAMQSTETINNYL